MKKSHAKNAHKEGKAHHSNEMGHHKMRDIHKAKSQGLKNEHFGNEKQAPMHVAGAEPSHLIGGTSSDNHQQGIERKKMRPGQLDVGHHGSMSDGWRHERHGE